MNELATDMYLYVSEYEIQKYDGEVLKLYVNNKLIRIIANPTEEDLRLFGYKNLVSTMRPEEKEGFYIEQFYQDGATVITISYRYVEIQPEPTEETEE